MLSKNAHEVQVTTGTLGCADDCAPMIGWDERIEDYRRQSLASSINCVLETCSDREEP